MGSCSTRSSCSGCYDLMDQDSSSQSKLEEPKRKITQINTKANIPGLDLLAQTKTASDDNLVPFSEIFPKQFQQKNKTFFCIPTDHIAWASGFCKNMSKYEGRFLPKRQCLDHGEPKRTGCKKRRKFKAKKKREAYKKRLDQKEKKMCKL